MRPSTVAFVVWALGTTPAHASQAPAAAAKPPAEKGPEAPASTAPVQAPAELRLQLRHHRPRKRIPTNQAGAAIRS